MIRPLRAVVAVLLVFLPGAARAHNPDALWQIVHGRCVPDMRLHADPAPCTRLDLEHGEAAGVAVLKDIEGQEQFLLIPTARITGIESPVLLAPGTPNYFAAAWAATPLVGARLDRVLPRTDLALAVNSEHGRSQNQLHIHLDCIGTAIRAALDRNADRIGPQWRVLPVRLAGHRYRARRIEGETPGAADPFRLLAASLADPAREMGRHTLVLVGALDRGRPGFVLLDGRATPLTARLGARLALGPGSGEELEDHSCRIARAAGGADTPPPTEQQAEPHVP